MLPFLLPAIAAQLEAWKGRPLVLGIAAGTIVTGVAIYTLANLTFPYWPDSVKNPLVEVTFRMLGNGLVAPNVGSALGLPAWLAVVPYLLLIHVLLFRTIYRAGGSRAPVIAAAVGTAILVAYAFLPQSPRAHTDHVYSVVRTSVLQR
jgi:hypothetical protein